MPSEFQIFYHKNTKPFEWLPGNTVQLISVFLARQPPVGDGLLINEVRFS